MESLIQILKEAIKNDDVEILKVLLSDRCEFKRRRLAEISQTTVNSLMDKLISNLKHSILEEKERCLAEILTEFTEVTSTTQEEQAENVGKTAKKNEAFVAWVEEKRSRTLKDFSDLVAGELIKVLRSEAYRSTENKIDIIHKKYVDEFKAKLEAIKNEYTYATRGGDNRATLKTVTEEKNKYELIANADEKKYSAFSDEVDSLYQEISYLASNKIKTIRILTNDQYDYQICTPEDVVKLYDYNLSPNADLYDTPLLMYAIKEKKPKCVQCLIEAGADFLCKKGGKNALEEALSSDDQLVREHFCKGVAKLDILSILPFDYARYKRIEFSKRNEESEESEESQRNYEAVKAYVKKMKVVFERCFVAGVTAFDAYARGRTANFYPEGSWISSLFAKKYPVLEARKTVYDLFDSFYFSWKSFNPREFSSDFNRLYFANSIYKGKFTNTIKDHLSDFNQDKIQHHLVTLAKKLEVEAAADKKIPELRTYSAKDLPELQEIAKDSAISIAEKAVSAYDEAVIRIASEDKVEQDGGAIQFYKARVGFSLLKRNYLTIDKDHFLSKFNIVEKLNTLADNGVYKKMADQGGELESDRKAKEFASQPRNGNRRRMTK